MQPAAQWDQKFAFPALAGKVGLKREKSNRTLPQLLSAADLKRFFETVQGAENIKHELTLRFLLFTSPEG